MIGSRVRRLGAERGHGVRLVALHPTDLKPPVERLATAVSARTARESAAQLVRDGGFEPVIVGGRARGQEFEPGAKVYNTGMSGQDLRKVFTKQPSSGGEVTPSA